MHLKINSFFKLKQLEISRPRQRVLYDCVKNEGLVCEVPKVRILIKLCKTRRTGKHHRDLSRQKQTLNKPKKPAVSPTQSDSFSYKLSFLEFVCLMRKSLSSGWQTSDGPITRCVEPSLFWHKMVLVENLRVDLSKNNAHYAQMFCPDM